MFFYRLRIFSFAEWTQRVAARLKRGIQASDDHHQEEEMGRLASEVTNKTENKSFLDALNRFEKEERDLLDDGSVRVHNFQRRRQAK